MARLPQTGKDSGTWGDILNSYLLQEHTPAGTHVPTKILGNPASDGQMLIADSANAKGVAWVNDDKARNSEVVHLTTNETVQGEKIFTGFIDKGSQVHNVRAYGAAGDGTADDTAAINTALAAIGSEGGGTLYLPAGTYLISSQLNLPSNCTVMGAGYTTLLKRRTGSVDYLVNILRIDNKQNVRITNLRIDAQKQDIIDNYRTTAVSGGYMYTTCNGIYITGGAGTPSKNIMIDHCWLHDAFYGNIEGDNADGLVIDSNYIYYGRDNQINLRVNGQGGYCCNVAINNNVVFGQGPIAAQNQFSGIQVLRGQYISITGNVCYGLGNTETFEGNGIGLEGCRHVAITGNNCHHNLVQGIKVDRTVEGAPANWDSVETYVPGEFVKHGNLNFKALTQNRAIAPPTSATSSTDWEYAASGPWTQLSVDVVVSGNVVANNNYFASHAIQSRGIFFQYCEEVLIDGNTVYGNYMGISNGYRSGSAVVSNNQIYAQEHTAVTLWNDVEAYGPVIIEGNYVARSGRKGIDSVVPAIIRNNVVEKNGEAGISASVTGTVVQPKPFYLIAGNTLIDNGDSGILVNGSFSTTVPVEVRENYAPPSTIQPRGLGENGTAVRCTNNRFVSQKIESWYVTNSGSVWIDEKTEQVRKVTANYTMQQDDQMIFADPTGGNITITLLSPNATHPHAQPGRVVTVVKTITTANTVTVAAAGGSVLAPTTIGNQMAQRFVSDGTNWLPA